MNSELKQISDFLTVTPNATLAQYYEHVQKTHNATENAYLAKMKEWDEYFKNTYVGKYVIVNHNNSSFTVVGPIKEEYNKCSSIILDTVSIDIRATEGEVAYTVYRPDQRCAFNAFWLYYPMPYPDNRYMNVSDKHTVIITKEQFDSILQHTNEQIAKERAALQDLISTNGYVK